MHNLSYVDAVSELKKSHAFGIYQGLDTIKNLCAEMGNPQRTFASIQITGTNGKTSVSRLIDALLRASGQRSSLYTSPELIELTERILVDGAQITREKFAEALCATYDAREELHAHNKYSDVTEFELMTAAALWAMRDAAVDFGVLEVGLGGRWDATSVVDPSVAVITGIGLDHVHILGDTVEEIAWDKAHVIKAGSTAVLGAGLGALAQIFLDRAAEVGAQVRAVAHIDEDSPVIEELTTRYEVLEVRKHPETVVEAVFRVKTPLRDYGTLRVSAPAYQAINVATSITAAESALGRALNAEDIAHAVACMGFPGRFEVVQAHPLCLFDGAHNPQAAAILADMLTLADIHPVIAFGGFADKDIRTMVEILAPVARAFVVVQPDSPRAARPHDVATIIRSVCDVEILAQLTNPTLEAILEVTGVEPLVITGSLSLYVLLKSTHNEPLECS